MGCMTSWLYLHLTDPLAEPETRFESGVCLQRVATDRSARRLTASVVLSDMNSKRLALLAGIFALMVWSLGLAQSNGPSGADPKTIPVIDAGLGPCSADFTVTDTAGAPVYDAKIRAHMAYGFMNVRKLDLAVGTN